MQAKNDALQWLVLVANMTLIVVKSRQRFHARVSPALNDALQWQLVAVKSGQGFLYQSGWARVKMLVQTQRKIRNFDKYEHGVSQYNEKKKS